MHNISETTLQMLNEQIVREGFNANRYAAMGAAFSKIGLDNLAEYFAVKQNAEEREHQDKIRKYIMDRNETVLSLSIPEFSLTIPAIDLIGMADIYVKAEQETTMWLKKIALTAFAEGDLLTYNFLTEMLLEQRAQEDEAMTLYDKATLTDNAPEVILLFDADFEG